MIEPTEAEKRHISALMRERPDWQFMIMTSRFKDEGHDEDERYAYEQAHPYVLGMKYVIGEALIQSPSMILDIGSPIAQSVALGQFFPVTVVDIRPYPDPEELGVKWEIGNATSIPYEDGSVEFLTSCWTMCHVGDGRYGDTFDHDGDLKMMREVYRVLQKDGIAIIGVGPVDEKPGIIFNAHRVYSWKWLLPKLISMGFKVIETVDFPVRSELFMDATWSNEYGTINRRQGSYGMVRLTK